LYSNHTSSSAGKLQTLNLRTTWVFVDLQKRPAIGQNCS